MLATESVVGSEISSGIRNRVGVACKIVSAGGGQVVAGSFINGKIVTTAGRPFEIINPATGVVVASYALATPADVDAAVAAARAAQPSWARATPAERATVLAQLARLAAENADELVDQEVSQTGKPVRLATNFDVPGSIDNIDFFAGAARHLEGKATA